MIHKIFNELFFKKLSPQGKLLYIWLISHKETNLLGIIKYELLVEQDRYLEKEGYNELDYYKLISIINDGKCDYIVINNWHKYKINNSSNRKKAAELIETLPISLKNHIKSLNVNLKIKKSNFVKPSIDEILNYVISIGYMIDSKKFIEYYENQSLKYGIKDYWVDSRGKKITNWKSKLRNVWVKEKNKINIVENTPEKYKYFHVVVDGIPYFPDKWVNGKPKSNNFIINRKLQNKFNEHLS